MATAKPPTTALSPKHDDNNKLDSGSYHWGSFVPSSPKMRQLMTEHKAQQTQEESLQAATKKTLT